MSRRLEFPIAIYAAECISCPLLAGPLFSDPDFVASQAYLAQFTEDLAELCFASQISVLWLVDLQTE